MEPEVEVSKPVAKTMGFIILRYVNSELSDKYWKYNYDLIRKFYPENAIMIIDDNSNSRYLTKKVMTNTIVIQSEFHQRGELLPYLYYLQNPIADIVMILHDSMFITKYIDFSDVNCYKSLWDFRHRWDQIQDEKHIIQVYNNPLLSSFHHVKTLWDGCFGGASIITHEFLRFIYTDYDLFKITDRITSRYNRMSFERVIGCIMQVQYHKYQKKQEVGPEDKNPAFFGDIHKYCVWESITFSNKEKYEYLPIIKVWTGR
jgi:hypothetical protein